MGYVKSNYTRNDMILYTKLQTTQIQLNYTSIHLHTQYLPTILPNHHRPPPTPLMPAPRIALPILLLK